METRIRRAKNYFSLVCSINSSFHLFFYLVTPINPDWERDLGQTDHPVGSSVTIFFDKVIAVL